MMKPKPCPFCGATPKVSKKKLAMNTVFVIDQIHYKECYLYGFREPENEGYVDEESAIKSWNKRFRECDRDALLELAKDIEGSVKDAGGEGSVSLMMLDIADRILNCCDVEVVSNED